jgi:hypothetical protein
MIHASRIASGLADHILKIASPDTNPKAPIENAFRRGFGSASRSGRPPKVAQPAPFSTRRRHVMGHAERSADPCSGRRKRIDLPSNSSSIASTRQGTAEFRAALLAIREAEQRLAPTG